MTDLALAFDPVTGGDLVIAGGGLLTDAGLKTAVVMSLFTDARARADDRRAYEDGDPRGWWGDAVPAVPGDVTGSRFWLLQREKLTGETALKARDICSEALSWLIADGIASAVDIDVALLPVTAARPSGGLTIDIGITRPAPASNARFAFAWNAQRGSLKA